MRYFLHDLDPAQFERLAVSICHEILGPGIQEFATGRDGGRDAKFVGSAQQFPSSASPISGTTIVQAKHTLDPVGKFSDPGFAGHAPSSVLTKEMPRILRLRQNNQLDNYLLFSNRRLGSKANEDIINRITQETGVPVVHLFGIEAIERFTARYPHLASQLSEFELAMPLRVTPDDLAEVITTIAAHRDQIDWHKGPSATPLERVAFARKNTTNGLSEEYAALITRGYLKDFSIIKRFLGDPTNAAVLQQYLDAVDEFAAKLVAHRNDFESYDKLLEHVLDGLLARDVDLAANKRLTRTVLYFMYWACDIGTEAT